MLKIAIQTADVCEVECDVLVLKYAQGFYGADGVVATALGQARRKDIRVEPEPDEHVLIESRGAITAPHVLFVGVVPLINFDYSEIRSFTTRALTIVSEELPEATHIAMTMHGAGYGLDEREAFLAQIGGLMDAATNDVSAQTITIVERNVTRAARLRLILRKAWPASQGVLASPNKKPLDQPRRITAGAESQNKPHIFVAMPFSKDLEDVFVFGIQAPINGAGYLCERVDMAIFTGDILDRIKTRIETAALIVADLTGANPNVYLEVGYAWGKNRPTLLLVKKADEVKFDVRGQRCIAYENIVDLAKKLQVDLTALAKA
jgi:hypothetical protein